LRSYFYRTTHVLYVPSAVLLWYVVCPSVRQSVNIMPKLMASLV